MSEQFKPYTGTGVCDVCNRPLGDVDAYIVPNDTFYASWKYRQYVRSSPLATLFGHTMDDSYFNQMRARDNSAGSAVCQDCIYMFESTDKQNQPAYAPQPVQPAPSPQFNKPKTDPDLQRAAEAVSSMFTRLTVPLKPKKKKKALLIASIIAGVLIVFGVALAIILSQQSGQGSGTASTDRSERETNARDAANDRPADTQKPAAEKPPAQETEPAPEPDVFPVSYTAFDNNYSITGYEIGIGDDGTTTVTLLGGGYSILPFRNGQISVPVWASFYSAGVEYESTGCETSSDRVTYFFKVTNQPETIVARNGDTDEIIVTINTGKGPAMQPPATSPGTEPATNKPGSEPAAGGDAGSLAFYPASNQNEHGNSGANIMNGGSVVEKGGWIYYSNGESLSKVRTNGTQLTVLVQSEFMYIGCLNVIGDWIYYIDYNIDYASSSSNSVLYRIRADGSQKARLSERHCDSMSVVGDWIYFSTYSAFEDDIEKIMDFGIYSIRTDGTQETLLRYGNYRGITVDGDWIYYSDAGNLFKMHKTGGDPIPVTYGAQGAGYFVSSGWVYYTDYSYGNSLFRVGIDGGAEEIINEEYSIYINTDGHYIYFSNFDFKFDDVEYGIYRINTDGTGKTMVYSGQAVGLCIAAGSIFFRDLENEGFFRIRLDGTGLEQME